MIWWFLLETFRFSHFINHLQYNDYLIQWADSEHKNENRYLNVLAAFPLRKSCTCTMHHVSMFQIKIILYKWWKRINMWINVKYIIRRYIDLVWNAECITCNMQYEVHSSFRQIVWKCIVWKHEKMRNIYKTSYTIQWMNEWMNGIQHNATFAKLKIHQLE